MMDETHNEAHNILVHRLGPDGNISRVMRHEFAELSAEAKRLISELRSGNVDEVEAGLFYIHFKCAELSKDR